MPTPTAIEWEKYRQIVILTGAGVSVASGLPTYRGEGGLWESRNIAWIADAANLPGSLPALWKLYNERREKALGAQPNAAHNAIADVQKQWGSGTRSITLVTQNVDGLHQRAGSPDVVELHGSAFRTRCTNASCSLPAFADETVYGDDVPTCPECGSPLRPDVVLFGEMLPAAATWQVNRALRECDLFLAAGTSGLVSPASNLVRGAAYAGARTILVNLDPMDPRDPSFQEEYLGRAEQILPVLFGS
uniref:protein acetyllysine N-acetyltransferase n=1 Tax=uncultured Armatimonadetes bacterium TaxID=157466 RepID=A0A6J4J9N9_9BACT|nr:NAD-dependent protein deacetylase of SIR2 family [uncultured Armatimonadetes bacterium]